MTGRPATKSAPCPVCGRDHFCRIWEEDGIVLCSAVESGCMRRADGSKVEAKGGMGWFHKLVAKRAGGNGHVPRPPPAETKLTVTVIRAMLSEFAEQMTPELIKSVSINLGVSTESLKAYGAGFCNRRGCVTFPMFRGDLKPVGIRTRSLDGAAKRAVKGSSTGIFVPENYSTAIDCAGYLDATPLLLLLPEGPTDCMALYDLGFRAIGRPSNNGGADEIRDLLSAAAKQDVVIVADNDKPHWQPDGVPFVPGWEGALSLADKIFSACNTLCIIRPPGHEKDIRKWFNTSPDASMIEGLIAEAGQLTRMALTRKMHDMTGWKLKGRADRLLNHPAETKYRDDPKALATARNEAIRAYKAWQEKAA